MNTERMTDVVALLAFLRARLDEDEAPARAESDLAPRLIDPSEFTLTYGWARFTEHVSGGSGVGYAPGAPTPARVLADVAAKRRIIEAAEEYIDAGEIRPGTTWNDDAAGADAALDLLRMMAMPYADHPDYEPAWRP